MPDLDDRIRALVARAVADAPPPPTIDRSTALTRTPAGDGRRPGSRWVVGGLAGLSAAAALIAIVSLPRAEQAGEPTVPLAPAPTAPPTVADTTPGTVVDDVPTPTVPASTDAPAADPLPAPTDPAGSVISGRFVSAGPEGVWAEIGGPGGVGGSGGSVTSEPMSVAFRVPDDRVFMQRSSDNRDANADTSILVAVPDGSGELVGQPMPTPELAEAALRLHDAAVIDGDVVLLIESGPGPCASPDDCDGSLWALRVDTGELGLILTENMWESGFGRLHLADTGVIVGERFSEALSMPFFAVVPGSAAVAPTPESLGLEAEYFDCSTCPRSFTIDQAGTTIAWLEAETDADGVIVQSVLVLVSIDTDTVDRLPLVDQRGERVLLPVPSPWLELTPDQPGGRWIVVNAQPDTASDPVATLAIDTAGGVVAAAFDGRGPGTVVTVG